MEGPQKVAEGPVTEARGDGVKTKNGCENVFLSPPGGGSQYYFPEISSDLGHYFLPSRPEKSQITHPEWGAVTSARTSGRTPS